MCPPTRVRRRKTVESGAEQGARKPGYDLDDGAIRRVDLPRVSLRDTSGCQYTASCVRNNGH